MFLSVSVRHVRAHPGGHQHDVSIQIPINLGKTFLPISRIRNIPLTWILARVFAYLPPFISQILDFIYWTVLIFISIYFEWRDTENQQFYFFYHVSMGNERVYNDQLMEFFHFSQKMLSLWTLSKLRHLPPATRHPPPATRVNHPCGHALSFLSVLGVGLVILWLWFDMKARPKLKWRRSSELNYRHVILQS